MPRTLPILALACVLGAFAVVACDSGSSGSDAGVTTVDAAAQRGPYAVGVTVRTMVDTSRPTNANGDFEGAPDRTMGVDIWFPATGDATVDELTDAELDASGAPYPLIVFSHGLSSSRRQSVSYTQHLASHGYVVVAPDFPLSSGNAPGGPSFTDVVNQPGDVSFVIDTMLDYSADSSDTFFEAVDGEAIGVTGHSLGGMTSVLTVFGEGRDQRIDAVLPISTPGCFFADGLAGDAAVPLLAIGGTRDLITPPAAARRPYDLANAPRYYAEFTGASHVRFADFDIDDEAIIGPLQTILGDLPDAEDTLGGTVGECLASPASDTDPDLTLERQGELLRIFATPFFDAYLRGNDDSLAFFENDLPDLVPEARVESDPG